MMILKVFIAAICINALLSSTVLAAETSLDQVRELSIGPENSSLLGHLDQYPNLEFLTISCVEDLEALPNEIGLLTHLKELNMDNGNGCAMNPKLPESLGNLENLYYLSLAGAQDNRDVETKTLKPRHPLPKSMAKLTNLEIIDLSRNGYNNIPPQVRGLKGLKVLILSFNDLRDLPEWLSTMPKLSKVILGDNCSITNNRSKMKSLKKRFPKIDLNFDNEFDCP